MATVEDRAAELLEAGGGPSGRLRSVRRRRGRTNHHKLPAVSPDEGAKWAPRWLVFIGIAILILTFAFRVAAWAIPTTVDETPVFATIGGHGKMPSVLAVSSDGSARVVTVGTAPVVVLPIVGATTPTAADTTASPGTDTTGTSGVTGPTGPTGTTGATGTTGGTTVRTVDSSLVGMHNRSSLTDRPSDGLMTLLIGTGAALILAGAFWWRGFTVTLPGLSFATSGLPREDARKVAPKAVTAARAKLEAEGLNTDDDAVIAFLRRLAPILSELALIAKLSAPPLAARSSALLFSGTHPAVADAVVRRPLTDSEASKIVAQAIDLGPTD